MAAPLRTSVAGSGELQSRLAWPLHKNLEAFDEKLENSGGLEKKKEEEDYEEAYE